MPANLQPVRTYADSLHNPNSTTAMDAIRRKIRTARTRLVLEQFVQRLLWSTFVGLGLAAIAIAAPKIFVVESAPDNWAAICLVAAAGLSFLVALGWTLFRRQTELDAAVELDLRFELKERVASSLFLGPDELQTRAGRALVEDAERRIERIDVGEQFGVRLGRRPWLPLVPAAIAVCLVAFVDDRTRPNQANAAAKVAIQKQVKNSAEALRNKIEKKKKEAVAKGLKDAEGLFKDLEKGAKDLTKNKAADRKKAVVKLNDLAKQLEDRRNRIGGKDDLRRQFDRLKRVGKGPAEKLAEALKKGNPKQAIEELKKLQDKIAKGQLDDKAKKQLEKQLQEMKQKLQEAADSQKQARDDLKKKIDEQKRQGNTQNAAKLQEQLDKLSQNKPKMDMLKDLAEKLGQCQQCMKQGDNAGAEKALEQLAQQMEGLQEQLEEMEMLDDMLSQIDEAKDSMGCKQCQGKGCEACQGQLGMGQNKGKKPGMGMGEGRGKGPRPDEKNDVAFRDSKVKQKTGKGRAVILGEADGANVKGQARQAIQDEIAAGVADQADPLAGERLPRSRREHAEEYFNAVRDGE